MEHVITDNNTLISIPDLEELFCFNGPVCHI